MLTGVLRLMLQHVHGTGMLEPSISAIWYKILHENCHKTVGGRPPLVVDVGANFGWFTFMSASMGCRCVGTRSRA